LGEKVEYGIALGLIAIVVLFIFASARGYEVAKRQGGGGAEKLGWVLGLAAALAVFCLYR
jgi:hypothetical protein